MRCLTVGVSVLRFPRGGVNEVPCTQCSFVAMNADFAPLHGESLDKLALQSNSAVSGQTGSVFRGSQAACSSGFAIIHRSVFDCTSRTLALQGKSVPWLLMSIESDLPRLQEYLRLHYVPRQSGEIPATGPGTPLFSRREPREVPQTPFFNSVMVIPVVLFR